MYLQMTLPYERRLEFCLFNSANNRRAGLYCKYTREINTMGNLKKKKKKKKKEN